MKLLTLEEVARGVPARWRAQYSRGYPTGAGFTDERKALIADLLDALDELTPDAIADIIGNRSWTNIECDNCGAEELPAAVTVGPDDPYSNRTSTICQTCAAAALALFPEAAE